jgi:DNA primase
MAGRIPDETLQAIRDRVSLVEVVSSYVSLKRAGRNHIGLCPFHGEKTPSFTVNEERGLFHCFGCGVGGTVFNFVMRIDRLEFPEAVEQLAKRAGVTLPTTGGSDPNSARRERLCAANDEAMRFYQQVLRSDAGAQARRYFAGRGLEPQTIERFGLGFAPPSGSALGAWLVKKRIASEVGSQAGLLARRADGSYYDRFRGRVMFPIRDRRANVIAFGGRTMGEDQPKYLNSPESPVFHKGQALYGLSEAREAIRRADRTVIVEGYLDALLLVQEGVPYSVATLGTALTTTQLRLLRPLGGEALDLLFCFDGDPAGRKAALRSFSVCAEAGVWGRAVFLPEGHDPDSYVREFGREAFERLLGKAQPLIDFYFDCAVPAGAALPERVRAAEEVKRILAKVSNDVSFALLASQAASRLGVDEEVFRRARAGAISPRPTAAPPQSAAAKWLPAEYGLIEAMAVDRSVAQWIAEEGSLGLLSNSQLADAGARIIETWERGGAIGDLMDELPEPLARRLTAVVLGGGPSGVDANWVEAARGCVGRLKEAAERRQRQVIQAELVEAERSGDESWRQKLEDLKHAHGRSGGGPV